MTQLVFGEFLGGRVFLMDDLDPATLDQVGGSATSGPSGPCRHPDGQVLVAEMEAHRIALAEPGDTWQRFGSHGSGDHEFDRPSGTAFLPSGELLVVDSGNGRVVSVSGIGGQGWTTYGERGTPAPGTTGEGLFADPRGVAVDSWGRIWVTDPGLRRVVRMHSIDGDGWTSVPLPAVGGRPASPYGIAAHGGGVAIIDVGNARLLVLDDAGTVTSTVPLRPPTWFSPAFVATTGASDLVVADVVTNTLWLFEDQGAGHVATTSLRGSPPDVVQPLFDSIGGVG